MLKLNLVRTENSQVELLIHCRFLGQIHTRIKHRLFRKYKKYTKYLKLIGLVIPSKYGTTISPIPSSFSVIKPNSQQKSSYFLLTKSLYIQQPMSMIDRMNHAIYICSLIIVIDIYELRENYIFLMQAQVLAVNKLLWASGQ